MTQPNDGGPAFPQADSYAPSVEALEHKTGCFAESGLYVQGRGYNRVRGCYSCGVEQHFPDGLNIPRYTFDRGGYPHSDDEGGFVAYSSVEEFVARVRREARAEAFEEVATAASRKAMGWSFTIDGEKIASEFVAFQNSIKALAAKERAK